MSKVYRSFLSRKLRITISILFLYCHYLQAQSIVFHYNDGSFSAYNLTDVRKITFDSDFMKLHFWNGSISNWNINTINYYEYSQNSANLSELNHKNKFFDVKVYPNPVNSHVNIYFNLPKEDDISIYFYDLEGKLILEKDLGPIGCGEYNETLQLPNIKSGTYVCLIKGNHNSFKKKIIVNC